MNTTNDCYPGGQQAQPMPDPAAASNAPTLRETRHIFAAAAKAGFADLAKALLCEYDVEQLEWSDIASGTRKEQLAEMDPSLYDQFISQLERRCGLCLRD